MRLRLRPRIRWSESCNLGCSYCYQTGWHAPGRLMSHKVLARILEELRDCSFLPARITWTGGEPTSHGLPRFRSAVGLADSVLGPGQAQHQLETNGTLLDRPWVRFLAESKFSVLLSLDGPELIHESHRRGSHRNAVAGLTMLAEADVPVDVTCLVTPVTLAAADYLLSYFQRLGVRTIDVPPAMRLGPEGVAPLVTPPEYGRFLCRLLDSWDKLEEPRPLVRPLEALGRRMTWRPSLYCRTENACSRHLTFTARGDVYPCDVFSALEGFRLGNILESSLPEISMGEPARRIFGTWGKPPRECLECKWESVCLGGCPLERLAGGGPNHPSFYCAAWKCLMEHIWKRGSSFLQCEAPSDILLWVRRPASDN